MTSWINSAPRPVSFCAPAARAFLEVNRVKAGTATAETPAVRARKERRDGMGTSPSAAAGTPVLSTSLSAFRRNGSILILLL
jgi:hypothetical protein